MRQHKYRYWYGGKMLEVGQIEFFTDGSYRVNDELVGGVLLQSTNLKDKNGKEIYEGDVVGYYVYLGQLEQNGQPEWEGATVTIEWDSAKACFNVPSSDPLRAEPHSVKIIGNIYENPDLLKEESL